jgi:hypothetical protein
MIALFTAREAAKAGERDWALILPPCRRAASILTKQTQQAVAVFVP